MLTKYTGELLLAPCPTVLVTSKYNNNENVLTVSWAGIASSHPEYVTISINPKRYSYLLISKSKKFCINIPDSNLVNAIDFCGNNSGKEIDKFSVCRFSKKYISDYILIEQCKMQILCNVIKIIELGSHHLFIAKVEEKYINVDPNDNIYNSLNPVAYFRPYYYKLEKHNIGKYGYTKTKNKKTSEL